MFISCSIYSNVTPQLNPSHPHHLLQTHSQSANTMSAPEPVFVQQITEWLSSEQNIATVDELGKRAFGRLAYFSYTVRELLTFVSLILFDSVMLSLVFATFLSIRLILNLLTLSTFFNIVDLQTSLSRPSSFPSFPLFLPYSLIPPFISTTLSLSLSAHALFVPPQSPINETSASVNPNSFNTSTSNPSSARDWPKFPDSGLGRSPDVPLSVERVPQRRIGTVCPIWRMWSLSWILGITGLSI
jgi:hypothetical protein